MKLPPDEQELFERLDSIFPNYVGHSVAGYDDLKRHGYLVPTDRQDPMSELHLSVLGVERLSELRNKAKTPEPTPTPTTDWMG